jgi:cysteinyl-tRNA synthetase
VVAVSLGGVDLIFPHHENEIAQSEAKTGEKPFVKYWVHGAHILVDNRKMSKSLHNFFTLDELQKQEFDPLALRYLFLQTHYRQEMNFTFEALEGAQNALNKLRDEVSIWDKPKIGCAEFEERFLEAINDDLNMPKALAVVWELVKSDNPTSAKAQSLFKFDNILGLNLSEVEKKITTEDIPQEVLSLIKERDALRKEKRFHLADQLRHKIKKLGYDVEDKQGKTEIKRV